MASRKFEEALRLLDTAHPVFRWSSGGETLDTDLVLGYRAQALPH